MTTQNKITVGVSFLIAVILFFSFLNGSIADKLGTVIRILPFLLILGLSIYKLAIWFGHRNNPEERERVVYSGQIYPEKVRRWLMDEREGERGKAIKPELDSQQKDQTTSKGKIK